MKKREYARNGLFVIAVFAAMAAVECPAEASIVTYELIDATASFAADSAIGSSPFTLKIGGTFSYDTTTQTTTSVDITLSGPIPSVLSQFETYSYSAVFTGTGYTGPSFSALDAPFNNVIALRFLNPLGGLGDNPLTQSAPAFFMESSQYGIFTETSVTGFAQSVPEPSTWAMLLLGFAGIGLMAYRRTRKTVEYPVA